MRTEHLYRYMNTIIWNYCKKKKRMITTITICRCFCANKIQLTRIYGLALNILLYDAQKRLFSLKIFIVYKHAQSVNLKFYR